MKKWNESFVPVYSSLETPLPKNIHLLSMETIIREDNGKVEEEAKIILRLENFYENYELDEVTEINLDKLFKSLSITSLVEMNLSANQQISKKSMMDWMVEGKDKKDARRLKRSLATSGSGKIEGIRSPSTSEFGKAGDSNIRSEDKRSPSPNTESQTIGHSVRLKPMEIRTFVITVKHKEPQAELVKTTTTTSIQSRRSETSDRYVDKNGNIIF